MLSTYSSIQLHTGVLPVTKGSLMEAFQSSYRTKHSTETSACLKVFKSDILSVLDVVVMLDSSAAFDTIEHDFLPSCLRDMYIVFRIKSSTGLNLTYLIYKQ